MGLTRSAKINGYEGIFKNNEGNISYSYITSSNLTNWDSDKNIDFIFQLDSLQNKR